MALPNYGGRGNLLYDPQSSYGWKGVSYQDGNGDVQWDAMTKYLDGEGGIADANENPESYWTRLLGERGYNGFDSRSTAARGLYGRAVDAYGAARLTNKDLKWTDFAGNVDMDQLLAQMSPQERGENESNYAPMNVRWLPR